MNYYEWQEESFDDAVKREMTLPVWERLSLIKDYLRSTSFSPYYQRTHGMRIAI